jgi:uncharacterized protein
MSHNVSIKSTTQSPPWWQFGYLWLVIAGPLCVVIASFVTFYLAWSNPDPVVSQNYYLEGLQINQSPAMQARNHAATGVIVAPPVKAAVQK